MLPYLAAGPLAATDVTGPQITEVVPIRIHGTDTNWPPVLVFCVFVVVLGGVVAAVVFLRRAREATRHDRRPLDG